MEKRLIPLKELAEIIGVAPQTLYNRCAPGAERPFPIRPVRVGRSVKFDLQDIEAFIVKQKEN